jgi:hypothetical protein
MPADGFVPGNRLLAALPADILERFTLELELLAQQGGKLRRQSILSGVAAEHHPAMAITINRTRAIEVAA